MAVTIRLKRLGREHVNTFRICVSDRRTPRDGRVIEQIGSYIPQAPDPAKQLSVKAERATYWLGVGAEPSHTVRLLFQKAGVALPLKLRKPKSARKARRGKKAAPKAQ